MRYGQKLMIRDANAAEDRLILDGRAAGMGWGTIAKILDRKACNVKRSFERLTKERPGALTRDK